LQEAQNVERRFSRGRTDGKKAVWNETDVIDLIEHLPLAETTVCANRDLSSADAP